MSDSSDSSGSESGSYSGHGKVKKDKKDKKDKKEKKDKGEKKDKKDKDKGEKKDKKDKDKGDKKDKKDKDKKDKDKKDKGHTEGDREGISHGSAPSSYGFSDPDASIPQSFPPQSFPSESFSEGRSQPPPSSIPSIPSMPLMPAVAPLPSHDFHAPAPPSGNQPPPSGYRVPLTTGDEFIDPLKAGIPPCMDADGISPIFLGSALFEKSVQPCKIGPHLSPHAVVPYGGAAFAHHGRYDLLPFTPDTMEFVPTAGGRIPAGRRPIEGGYEESGAKLYHGVAVVSGVRVPGKTGEHLGGCNVAFNGTEYTLTEGYEILCWK